jgi:hypothetical protein
MRSILSRIDPSQVVASPFPYVAVENAVEPEFADRIRREFPPFEVITEGKDLGRNKKIYYTAARSLAEGKTTEFWKDVIRTHLQPSEWFEVLRVFGPHVEREHPRIRQLMGDLADLKVGTRSIDNFSTHDVLIDCKALVHTPFSGPRSIERAPNIKNFRTLFVWYLYLRPENDVSTGADHVFYRVKPGANVVLNARQTVDPEAIEAVRTVPYRHNTFVLWLNTPRSVQFNSPRSESNVPLMALHGSFYMRERLFEMPLKPNVSAIDFVMPQQQQKKETSWLRSLFRGRGD